MFLPEVIERYVFLFKYCIKDDLKLAILVTVQSVRDCQNQPIQSQFVAFRVKKSWIFH